MVRRLQIMMQRLWRLNGRCRLVQSKEMLLVRLLASWYVVYILEGYGDNGG